MKAVPQAVGQGSASIRSFTAKGTPSRADRGLPALYLRPTHDATTMSLGPSLSLSPQPEPQPRLSLHMALAA